MEVHTRDKVHTTRRKQGFDLERNEIELVSPEGRHEEATKLTPNQPHPALEYPALFFILKKWPWLHDNIEGFYNLRWRMSYPLQKNVPWSPSLRKLRIHLTWGELLILLPFWVAVLVAVFYTFYAPSVTNTGHVARTALIGCIAFAQRNSVITLLFGMPIDRALFYHKLSARIALIGTIGHAWAFFIDPKHQRDKSSLGAKLATAFEDSVHTSGTMMSIMMLSIMLTALPAVRRRLFELFYYVHVTLVFGVICGALFHTGVLLPILAIGTWGVDVFLRSIVMARARYPRKAKLRVMSSTVVELSFPKIQGFDYNPGQYIYIAIPEISWLQWHPFSLSSSPQMKTVTLHIRRSGDWTSVLYELAKKKSEVSFLCEGPYGSLGVNLFGDRYKMVMLVSGGIGITPMQSICDQLFFEQARGMRNLKKLKFIWTDRDPIMMKEAPVVRRSSSIVVPGQIDDGVLSDSETDSGYSIDFFSQILSLVPPGMSTDRELEQFYESLDLVMELDAEYLDEFELEDPLPNRNGKGESPSQRAAKMRIDENTMSDNHQELWHVNDSKDLAEVLDMQLYLTGNNGNLVLNVPNAVAGRPNIKDIFVGMKMEALAKGERRVAVCVCAPRKLSDLCRKACIVYSDDLVRFDFHTESMEA